MRFSLAFLSGLALAGSTLAMTYHDNGVAIPFVGNDYSLQGGGFSTEELSITNGQDPDPRNRVGDVKWFGPGGSFSFSVGRKGSGQVRDWFNSKVSGDRTTFNHAPGELNFAFLGKLNFTFKGPGLASNGENFEVPRAMLAQGKSGSSNNWWFGGQNCWNISINRVRCKVVRSLATSESWEMDFIRGNNDVSKVEALNLVRVG
ncbi:hypothetical protein BKA70DRAFT_1524507 [Coprinopsis sp. MPI-PUGE-AT-0042]|nr:hypothetical protein BKA70DRAFT_1524507 [Coprinopsis sp. MPI-PUGE-AT-0042]